MNPITTRTLMRGEPSLEYAMPFFGPTRVQQSMGFHVRPSRGAVAEERRATRVPAHDPLHNLRLFHGVSFRFEHRDQPGKGGVRKGPDGVPNRPKTQRIGPH